MEKRQAMIAGGIGLALLAAGGAWWLLQGGDEPSPATAPVVAKAPAPAAPPAPVIAGAAAGTATTPAAKAAGTPESDAVALSEEEIDKVGKEKEDLAARAADLESQVQDGKMLLDMKEKQIKELEAQLKAQSARK